MIARQGFWVTLNNVAGAVQGFAALFLVARYMGDEALGSRSYALAFVALAGILARLGFPTTHVRRLAQGDESAASIGTFLALKLALTLALVTAGAAIWLALGPNTLQDTTPTAILLAFGIVVVQSLRDVPVATFQGLRRIRDRELVLFTNTAVTVALTALVAIAFAASHGRWSPVAGAATSFQSLLGLTGPMALDTGIDLLLGAVLVGEAVALVLATGLFVRARIAVAKPSRRIARLYLAFTLPLMLLAVGEVATKWSSQVLLGFWWDASELGQFAAPSKLSELFLILGTSLSVVLLPALSTLHSRGQDGEALRLAQAAERWTSLLLWPVLTIVLLIPGSLIHVGLSDRFARGESALVLLSAQAFLTGLLFPVQALAISSGRPRFAARVILATLVAALLLNLVLVPPAGGAWPSLGLGATGAALAALGATALAFLLYRIPTATWPGHPLFRRNLLLHAVAAGLTFAAFRLARIPEPERFVTLMPYGLGVIALYGIVLVLLRELRRGDWGDLRRLLATSKSD
ncbi:MAG: oligosaccharide flippase family protein [Candidatus Thermoplasmatota archaeon]|mgnify:CR=1 FL=1